VKNFSKVFFTVLIVALLFVGCKTSSEPVAEVPVAEPAVSAPAEEVKEPLNVEIEAFGMKFVATRLAADQLIITIPEDISEADMVDFINLVAASSPEYFAPLQYAIGKGYVILVFPYEFTDEEIIAFAEPMAQALVNYVPARVQYYADLDAQAQAAAAAAQAAAEKAAAEAQAAAEAAAKAAAEKAAAEKAAAEKAAAEKAAAEKAAAEAAVEKAAQEAAAKAAEAKATAEKAAAAEKAASKKSGAGTVILIIVLVLLAAACAYYFMVFRKKGTK